jgi:hypothetical protein
VAARARCRGSRSLPAQHHELEAGDDLAKMLDLTWKRSSGPDFRDQYTRARRRPGDGK